VHILALGAHPDDIEICMGGAMLAWRAAGAKLTFVVATDGARGAPGDPASVAALRAGEAAAAAAMFDAQLRLLNFPDGDLTGAAGLFGKLRETFARAQPDLIVTHDAGDYHPDHRALSDAARAAAGFLSPVLYCDTIAGVSFAPTHYIDIGPHFAAKCEAIACHASQDPERFVEMIRLQNGLRAIQCGGSHDDFAEAYRFVPSYPFVDIRGLLPPAPPVRPLRLRGDGH